MNSPVPEVTRSWMLWTETSHNVDAPAELSLHKQLSAQGTLGVRWLGEGLPLLCVTLTSLGCVVRLGVLLWSPGARNWLHDTLNGRRLNVLLEGKSGSTSLHTGDIEFTGRDLHDLLDLEYSVEPHDRGHALQAAALVLMSLPSESGRTLVRVATESAIEVDELLQLGCTTG
ncbi:MAG: hypothetical protein AB9M53_03825 [Leptothrix sp. (in: b-proteobacteria)]